MLQALFQQGPAMIRKLLLPLLALLALSGCVSDYYYRGGGSGDYYYSSPRSSYYYGAPYSSLGYGYPGGWYGGVGYGGGYGYYGGYGGYYGSRYGYPYYPYYPYYPRRPHYRPPPGPPNDDQRPPQPGDHVTGGNQPPRRVMVPQPQQAGAMPPRMIRGEDEGRPRMRLPRAEPGMPDMQDRPMRRPSSQPLAPERAESRPAPRMMEAPARPMQAPRMERHEAPARIRDRDVE